MMNQNQDCRKFKRIEIATLASIMDGHDNRIWNTKVLNLSLSGILLVRPDNWTFKSGTPFILSMREPNQATYINMEASLVHITKNSIGLRFDCMDTDNAALLYSLLELYLEESETPDDLGPVDTWCDDIVK